MKKNLTLLAILIGLSQGFVFSQTKFVGNIHQYYNDTNFTNYWNQVTPENAGKWVSCEPVRDEYTWEKLDEAYAFAKANGLTFKQHTFVWGNQYPKWMDDLSQEEQRAEVEEWIKDFGERYPDCDYIDVVNEALPYHAPAPFKDALGGDGETGWDWVVTSFELARKYCPNAELILNDFGIIDSPDNARQLAEIATILKDRGLIEGIGLQCHAFSMNGVTVETMNEVLDILDETGLDIYIAELDMEGDDNTQLERYEEKFSLLYNHESVKGITLWGYRKDHMWIPGGWLFNETDNTERPALEWMQSFILEKEEGHIVPGRIEAEAYFRQRGIDIIHANDTTILLNKINPSDWVSYVVNVLGDEEYEMNIRVSEVSNNSSISIWVNDVLQTSIEASEGKDTLNTKLKLAKGNQTLKLRFDGDADNENLMNIDWIELKGETLYHIVNATSDENGTISPAKEVYVANGDSATFTFDANTGYMPDMVLLDSLAISKASLSYTLTDITTDYSLHVTFKSCTSTDLDPYYAINDDSFESGTEVNAAELDSISLKVEYTEQATTYWLDNEGVQSYGNEFNMGYIEISQNGIYGFYHTDNFGCKNSVDFNLTVNQIELDVYEAEAYIDQSGIQTEDVQDIGGGKNVGYIENNDWCTYEIEIDTAGVYNFIARAATETNGGSIEISIDDEVLGSLKIKGSESSGWQDWYTTDAEEIVFKETGTQTIKLTFKGSGGYLFNFNWFDLNYSGPYTGINNDFRQVNAYPNPVNDLLNIDCPESFTQVEFYTMDGKLLNKITGYGTQASIDVSSFEPGVYLLMITSGPNVVTNKIFVE